MSSANQLKPSLNVSLIETPTERGEPYRKYDLAIKDTSGTWPDKIIPVADLSSLGGGISLETWELNWNGNQPVISVYLQISILGHDLDQWSHYDWESGEKLEDFRSPRELLARELLAKERADKLEARRARQAERRKQRADEKGK